jgi:hypothetical protein
VESEDFYNVNDVSSLPFNFNPTNERSLPFNFNPTNEKIG